MTTKNIFFNLGRLVALCGAIMDAEDHWRVLNFQAEPEKEKTIQYLLTKYSLNVVDCEEEKPEKCGGQMKNKKIVDYKTEKANKKTKTNVRSFLTKKGWREINSFARNIVDRSSGRGE